ncbi:MAG: Hpt domain-containing protein [Stenotrophomonas sp.]
MNTLRDAMSHAALGWVKPELDETLRQARNEIEYFVEDPADGSRMRFCAGYLHQVQGTLRMVELYAPAMVAEELEQLADAVRDGGVPDRDEACATLMRGTVLLPDYLERLQNGHRDIPIVLLPLLNEIRAARGAEGINESVLFAFNPEAGDASEAELEHARGSLAGRNRELLDTVGGAVKEELLRIKDALDLHVRMGGTPSDLQPQVDELNAVADTLGVMGLGVARGVVTQQRDALREVVAGTRAIDDNLLLDIAGALLYVDASLDDQVAYLGANLEGDDDPAAMETRRTVEVLAHEAIANFAAAREAFIAFIETNWDHARLQDVPRLLDEVAGALRMLNLPTPADYLGGVRQYIGVELIGRKRVPGGRQLDTLADAMASLEYYLEALRERRPGRDEILDITRSSLEALHYWPVPPERQEQDARAAEIVVATTATLPPVVSEEVVAPVASAPMPVPAPVAEAPVAAPRPLLFAEAIHARPVLPEPPVVVPSLPELPLPAFDPVAADAAPSVAVDDGLTFAALDADDGAVSAGLPELPDSIGTKPVTTHEIVGHEIAGDAEPVAAASDDFLSFDPVSAEDWTLADVPVDTSVAPFDFDAGIQPPETEPDATGLASATPFPVFDETAAASAGPTEVPVAEMDSEMAAFMAELNMAAASFDPLAAEAAPVPETAMPASSAVEAAFAAGTVPRVEGGFDDSAEQVDQDIREVFIEEFDEELENLGRLLPIWRAAPDNVERLRPVRRVFHTLKGSGRLVGARTLGEFSWKIESMLNRVLDGSRRASPAVVAMVNQAFEVLPQFNAALRGSGHIHSDVLGMQDVADRIAAGEEAFYVAGEVAAAAAPVAQPAAAESAPAGTPASVDSVLREILEAEVGQHLATVEEWLARSRPQPQPVTDEVLRAVHTMSGAFAMTDVPEITAVTAPAESFVKRSLANAVTPEVQGVDALAEAAAAVAATITALQAPSPLIPSFAPLAAKLQVLVDALPEAQWPPLVDDLAEDEVDDAATAGPEASAIAPEARLAETHELAGIEDLSAYFDPSLLDLPSAGSESVLPAVVEEDVIHLDEVAADLPTTLPEEMPVAFDAGLSPESVVETTDLQEQAPAVTSSVGAFDQGIADEVVDNTDAATVVLPPELPELPAEATASQASAEVEAPQASAEESAFDHETVEVVIEEAAIEAIDVPDEAASVVPEAELEAPLAMLDEHADVLAAEIEAEAVELAPLTAPVEEEIPAVQVAVASADKATLDAGPLDFEELDRELIDIFVEEGKDLLDHCDGVISQLRSAPEDRELLAELQRDLHTLKGGARMAGINAIGDLGHGIESLLEAVAANRTEIGRSDVQLLERGFDRLHQLLLHTGVHRAVQMPYDLVEAFEARTAGRSPVQEAAPVATLTPQPETPVEPVEAATSSFDVAAPEVTVGSEQTAEETLAPVSVETAAPVVDAIVAAGAEIANAPLSAPVVEAQATEEEGAPRTQEQVRVRADLLDSLVNHAGEVAIYRSRLEQQLGAFRNAMGELDRTNARLRDQLRRLDLETEAQIVARYQREQEQADHAFDPLELDRFSTLQQLSRALNESAADLGGLQGVLDDLSRNYDTLLQQQSRVSSELQDGLMRARMVPFDGLVPRLRRVVRQAAQETGKQVQLLLEGTHGELDRNVLDRMVAPLEHMLRNSVAHGLETPEQRQAAGKPEEGNITLRLRREGSEIVLEVADDGAGLDREAIRRRADQRGLIEAGAQLDDAQLDNLIFASGFSTSEQVSQLAGRGVGMDVVRNEVRQLGGSVDIRSVRGQGVTFTLRLPQTLAVTQAVFVRIGETTFAVPVASVSGIGRIARERFESGQGGYHYNGEDYSLHDLGTLVGQAAAKAEGQPQVPLLLVRAGELRAAVAIDQVLGNREIVVKPVGLQIASVQGIYGATITGEGNVVVILDVAPLVRRHLSQPQAPVQAEVAAGQHQVPLVMVVDDSLTMRKVTGRVLERHNFEVVVARDGVEALERLEERVPDLMLLDIEMPRMDGYELATAMRADDRYRAVPIVMITSRSGDKHRQRAFEIGVQRYLGKPYQELDLMRNVYDLLGIARARE